jgi:hypothetical protein
MPEGSKQDGEQAVGRTLVDDVDNTVIPEIVAPETSNRARFPGDFPGDPMKTGYSARTVNRLLAADLASVGEARSLVRGVLRGWRAEAIADDVVLVASELVSNALRHGMNIEPGGRDTAGADDASVWISLVRTNSHLICAVSDPSRQPPVRRAVDPMTGCGQGLALVESLSACWGWSSLDPIDPMGSLDPLGSLDSAARETTTMADGGQPAPAGGGKSVWAIFPLQSAAWSAGAA